MKQKLILDCYNRISPFIHRTPILTSTLLNEMTGSELYFKCENFQKMGAFKMRGALNAILQLEPSKREKGVVTHSSGNFAQALSLAAKNIGVMAHIVMPENAPEVKIKAVEGYEGLITRCKSTIKAREEATKRIIDETGATFIHPSNDLQVIIGNSTACFELMQDQPELDYVIAPVGGGGLIAGTALSVHLFGRNCKVVGAEPKAVDDAFRSLRNGKIEYNDSTNTIADGLRTHLGDLNFPIIQKYVDKIITVDEDRIVSAMKLLYERLKVVIEPSSAVAMAAIIKEVELFENKKVGIILSGGNVDLKNLPFNH